MEKEIPEQVHSKHIFNQFLESISQRVSREPHPINTQIPGPISKNTLAVYADKKCLEITVPLSGINDHSFEKPILEAELENDCLNFNLRNKIREVGDEKIHKDFFPKEFVNFVINKYFVSFGKTINTCKDHWYDYSDNFKEFQSNLNKGMSEIEAAKNTWSGRVYAENRFSEIAEVRRLKTKTGKDKIEVSFVKNSNQTI